MRKTFGLARRVERWAREQPPRQMSDAERDADFPYMNGFGDPRFCTVGLGTYGRPVVHVYRGDLAHGRRVTIGKYCSIAGGVEIFLGGNHRSDWVTTWPVRELNGLEGAYEEVLVSSGDVSIGNDVWIGRSAAIMSGVTIGDGAVIAARAVVAKDVRPYGIIVGNPGREVRRRFEDSVVDELLGIRWWDWSYEVVVRRADLLCGDPARLLAALRNGPGSRGEEVRQ